MQGIGGSGQSYVIYRPDIWGPYIDNIFKEKLFCAKFFEDFSDGVTEGGKTLVIPSAAAYTPSSVTTTTGDITANVVTDTGTRLDINNWEHVARVFTDFQQAQVAKNFRIKEIYADNMAHALAKSLDDDLMGLFTDSSVSRAVNASTAGLKSSDLEAALSIIESYNIPREECAWFFHPKAYFNEVLAVQKYYDAGQFGKGTPVAVGSHDYLYGVPVFVTNQVPTSATSSEGGGHRNLLVHMRAACYAIGNLPGGMPSGVRIQEKEGENLRKVVVADIMYGVKQLGGSYRAVRLISAN